MKLLFLSKGSNISDHPGYHDALIRLKEEGSISDFLNIPYLGFAKQHGWDSFYKEVVTLSEQHAFDVVYFQYFHNGGIPSPRTCIDALHKLNNTLIITSSGDPFSDNWMKSDYPEDFKEISRLADITFSTQMGRAADKMIKWGARNVVFSPHGMCQVRFKANSVNIHKHNFDFDVVFVGNNNGGIRLFNPISKYWLGAKHRQQLVKKLFKRFGNRFGLFGNGWDYTCVQGPIPFEQQQTAFRRGKVVVGGNPYSYSDYYSSNRPFFEISSGVPTVELVVPRLDRVLRNNDHCYFANDFDEVIERCEFLLNSDPQVIYSRAAKAAKYIEERHTQYHRMKFKIDTVKGYIKNDKKLEVNFPFFLPEVDLNEERHFAIRGK
ncbi:MAG: glycosyltransferase [Bacteroidota bacterium]